MIEVIIGELIEANTYIISDGGDALVVDPISDFDKIYWKVKKFHVKGIIATHGHSDHIGGIEELAVNLQVPVMIHPNEKSFLTPSIHSDVSYILREIQEGDFFQVGQKQWRIIDCPGHSPGGISLYLKEENILICGDVLFRDSIGRTDIYGSDSEVLIQTLRNKIFTLPGDTRVYPGHGPETTIARERAENPYIKWIFEH